MSAETSTKRKNRLSVWIDDFKAKSPADRRRVITDMLFNNAMYMIILIAIVYIAIRVPAFLSRSSIINIISLTAAKLPIALGIGGAIVLTGTDISAGRCVGLTACIAASLLQMTTYGKKIFPNIGVMPLWLVLLCVIAVGALIGFVNGFFVAKFKLHPFIVTLSTQLIVFGVVLMYLMLGGNNGQTLSGLDPSYTDFVRGTLFTVGGDAVPKYDLKEKYADHNTAYLSGTAYKGYASDNARCYSVGLIVQSGISGARCDSCTLNESGDSVHCSRQHKDQNDSPENIYAGDIRSLFI